VHILYLSHCVPNPPDKGEKIRSHYELIRLAELHRIHLVCFARTPEDLKAADQLRARCASVYAEPLSGSAALLRAGVRFGFGACLNEAFYRSTAMRRYIAGLQRTQTFDAAVAFTTVMAPYVPAGVPYLLDMVDLDSEKWFGYAEQRRPSFLYRLEGERYRRFEIRLAEKARQTIFTTRAEELLFRAVAPAAISTAYMENGVDFDYFDPAAVAVPPDLANRRILVFLGSMDYFPNIDAVCAFASSILPALRKSDPALELFIVGRNPAKAVQALASQPGVTVTGGVADTRPFLQASLAVIAPLRIARGIQNKVLEALAMDKTVLASASVAKTFGAELPVGIRPCDTAEDYAAWLASPVIPPDIRAAARARFSWRSNIDLLLRQL
jgi:sugar transferase (PEP-CTERM/EpsH1 system associated)